jgi:hypothetical protein
VRVGIEYSNAKPERRPGFMLEHQPVGSLKKEVREPRYQLPPQRNQDSPRTSERRLDQELAMTREML